MSYRRSYKVRARRWARGWELHVEGVGVTQSRSLSDAEMMVRDYIALDTGMPEDSFDVEITPEVGGQLGEELASARRATREAARAQLEAAERSRRVARQLVRAGLSGREVAAVLGVSPQRVSQLLERSRRVPRGRRRRTVDA
ncbi:MAG: hypothetical protein GEV03_01535 [Streptosporangiales bacterium]|nr:hypothetical protein [Streptosporangiales bacterium]